MSLWLGQLGNHASRMTINLNLIVDKFSQINLRLSVQICITFFLQNYAKITLFPSDSRVFTPKDGDNWMIAKLNLQLTDLGYSQMVEHLAKVSSCGFLGQVQTPYFT